MPSPAIRSSAQIVLPLRAYRVPQRSAYCATRYSPRPPSSVVAGMGGAPDRLAEDAERARDAGATELRLYHAGLASDEDLTAVRTALRKLG